MDCEVHVSVGDKAVDVSDVDGWKADFDECVDEASMPYFIKCLLHVHEYGRRVVFDVFGMHGCLCELEYFVMCGFVCPKARLFWVEFVVVFCPLCDFVCDDFFEDF